METIGSSSHVARYPSADTSCWNYFQLLPTPPLSPTSATSSSSSTERNDDQHDQLCSFDTIQVDDNDDSCLKYLDVCPLTPVYDVMETTAINLDREDFLIESLSLDDILADQMSRRSSLIDVITVASSRRSSLVDDIVEQVSQRSSLDDALSVDDVTSLAGDEELIAISSNHSLHEWDLERWLREEQDDWKEQQNENKELKEDIAELDDVQNLVDLNDMETEEDAEHTSQEEEQDLEEKYVEAVEWEEKSPLVKDCMWSQAILIPAELLFAVLERRRCASRTIKADSETALKAAVSDQSSRDSCFESNKTIAASRCGKSSLCTRISTANGRESEVTDNDIVENASLNEAGGVACRTNGIVHNPDELLSTTIQRKICSRRDEPQSDSDDDDIIVVDADSEEDDLENPVVKNSNQVESRITTSRPAATRESNLQADVRCALSVALPQSRLSEYLDEIHNYSCKRKSLDVQTSSSPPVARRRTSVSADRIGGQLWRHLTSDISASAASQHTKPYRRKELTTRRPINNSDCTIRYDNPSGDTLRSDFSSNDDHRRKCFRESDCNDDAYSDRSSSYSRSSAWFSPPSHIDNSRLIPFRQRHKKLVGARHYHCAAVQRRLHGKTASNSFNDRDPGSFVRRRWPAVDDRKIDCERRQQHSVLERNRRQDLRAQFAALQAVLFANGTERGSNNPNCFGRSIKSMARIQILERAVVVVRELNTKRRQLDEIMQKETERNQRLNSALQNCHIMSLL